MAKAKKSPDDILEQSPEEVLAEIVAPVPAEPYVGKVESVVDGKVVTLTGVFHDEQVEGSEIVRVTDKEWNQVNKWFLADK